MIRQAEMGKRVLDVAVAATMLLLTLPVIVLATLGAAVALRTWPIFSHVRVGRDGRPFRMFKIRTLPTSFSSYAAKYDLDDAKIPSFCALLRRTHLDELPQLVLVLTGRMSLVGPRPEMRHLVDEFDPAFAAKRSSVRPGCTGLWQVSERCNRMISEHPEFDLYYIRHRSLRLDFWILGRTLALLHPAGQASMVSYDQLLQRRAAPLGDAALASCEDREPQLAALDAAHSS